jgi:lysyl-tRNA synthetase class 2
MERGTQKTERRSALAERLWFRARVVQAIRAFFVSREYLEVETPVRIPAPAPEAHIDAVASGTWWLQTSPELCMKRLLAAGHPRLFQVCRCFREGERGRLHSPEFTMLEWYRAEADYLDLMAETETLVKSIACTLGVGDPLAFRGRQTALGGSWDRLTVRTAFRQFTATTADEAIAAGTFDELLALEVEPHLGCGRPLFLTDYPSPLAALARRKPEEPSVAERFELYVAGVELANGFTELTDADEQRVRFDAERRERRRAGKADYGSPEPFLADLEHMPPAAGIALGVDRLVMLLAGVDCIDDVVAFTPEGL